MKVGKRMQKKLIILIVLTGAVGSSPAAQKRTWPNVSQMDATFRVTEKNPHIETTIFSDTGESLYQLVCHEGDFEDDRTGSYNFLFHCKLMPVDGEDKFLDLFTPSRHWRRSRTRARFSGPDKCSDHPYYGLRRTFLIRGMRVELQMSGFTSEPSLREELERRLLKPTRYSFSFSVRVIPDPRATNEIAGPAEVCDVDYRLGKNGEVIETKEVYPDPAIDPPHKPAKSPKP